MTQTSILPADFHVFSLGGLVAGALILLTTGVLYVIGQGIYNLYFHPLRHIPGPFFARATAIPYVLRVRNGRIIPWLRALHDQYGDAVRITPRDVSFISGETAWQDIYGFHTGKNKKLGPYLKDRTFFPVPVNKTWSIIASDEEAHSRMRRNFSHAFSDKALRDQEGLVQDFVDYLIHRLHEQVREGVEAVDIMRWYNYTTFDIIADLTFGESLYCLRDRDYHPWVNMVFGGIKAIGLLAARKRSPLFEYYDRFWGLFIDTSRFSRMRTEFFAKTEAKVGERLEKETGRPDFMSFILKNQDSKTKALSRNEIDSNGVTFLAAGSETTATMLSGTTYLLLKNPDAYKKLAAEIRGRFKSMSEITFEEANKLDYLNACVQEGLRYFPPVPTGFPRVVPPGGDVVSGYYMPAGTSVCMSQHAANHSTRNFKDPDTFAPERWLGDERYKDDNRAVVNPFSFGPRNCLGKNLANAEMRVILAKMLFSFDLDLADKETDWMGACNCFTLWEKPPLMVKLLPLRS